MLSVQPLPVNEDEGSSIGGENGQESQTLGLHLSVVSIGSQRFSH